MRLNYDKRIYDEAIKAGFTNECARLVVAQARHETGNYTSPVFRLYKNCFGMRPAVVRETTRLKETSPTNYAIYASIEDSVKDIGLWFTARNVAKTFTQVYAYATALKNKGYFEAELNEYISGMINALKKISI